MPIGTPSQMLDNSRVPLASSISFEQDSVDSNPRPRSGMMAQDVDFSDGSQADLFGDEAAAPAYRPDIERVRLRLHRIISETRAADSLPSGRASLYLTIVPQMTQWLPEEEGAQLRLEFENEMERFKEAS